MERQSLRGHALPVLYLVLSSLSYLGTGGFMSLVADRVQIHKATVCRALWAFCSAMQLHIREFVQFPRGQTAEDYKVAFREKGGKYRFRMIRLYNIKI